MKKTNLLIPQNQIDHVLDANPSPTRFVTDALSLAILCLAVVALAFSPILTKLSELEINPIATIFNRLWIATVIISCWQLAKMPHKLESERPRARSTTKGLPACVPLTSLITRRSPNTSWELNTGGIKDQEESKNSRNSLGKYQQQGLLILASVSATASAVLWAVSFTQTSVASSTVLRSLTPLFISLGAWLFLNQTFKGQFILGMLLSVMGGMAIGWNDWQLGTEHLLGDVIALLSAALHGINILIIGYLRDRGSTTEQVLLWRCACGAIITLPFAYLSNTPLLPLSLLGWLAVIALALVCQTFGQGLLVFSLKQYSSSFVGIFALLKPIFTALLAWLIFAEAISINSAIAVMLILAGIYLAKISEANSISSNQ